MTNSTPEREVAMVPLVSVELAIAHYARTVTRLTVALVFSACLPLVGWFAALLVGNSRKQKKEG